MLLFAKVSDLLSLRLYQIDSSVFDESIRKVVHKYQPGKEGREQNVINSM